MRKVHFVLFVVGFVLSLGAQATILIGQKSSATKSSRGRKAVPKTISFGVLNGKAIELVKPVYPRSAQAVNVSGSVIINLLIDVDGRVITAKPRRGHPLLVASSIKAALDSTFAPITIGGNPVRVNGVIVYKYLPASMNWLELGYSADSIETLVEYLPAEFSEERNFLELSRLNPNETGTLDSAWSIIHGKLSSDEKARWLISVGRELAALTRFHWDPEKRKQGFGEIETLLNAKPNHISPNLSSRLSALIDPESSDQFNDNLLNLTDKLNTLGK